MSEKMELDAGRPESAGEMKEQEDLRALDEATHEPGEAVEQRGDYREAEAIQGAFESVVETGREIPVATPLPIPHPEDAADAQVDGKGGRPASVVSLDGKGNDLTAGDVPLAAPQASVHETGGPAFTLDGKGTDRSTHPAAEVPLAAPEQPQRGATPGPGDSSAKGKGIEDDGAEIMFRIQEATNRYSKAENTRSDVKKKSDSTDEDIIKNVKG
jgi:hypothetical protein